MAVLRAIQGPNPGQLFTLEGESAVLGRHPDCDIVLESGAVSRQHARISSVQGNYYVEDLRSRNGTFVNGRVVAERQLLAENDELTICEMTFRFHLRPPGLDVLPRKLQPDSETTAMIVDNDQGSTGSKIVSKVDVSSGSSGLKLELNTKAKLKALIEIGRGLGKAVGLDRVLSNLLDSLFSIFTQADQGFIVLKDPATERLVPKAVKYRRDEDAEMIRISRTIVGSVLATKEAILSADAAADSRFDMAESVVDLHIRSMMCAPLVAHEGDALGVIQIDTRDQRSRFCEEDLDVLASVACQAAIAVENAQLHESALRERALERELAIAHEVQRRLLPAGPPRIDQYGFFEFYEPANELGGDYYDYVQLSEGRLAVVVADVAGKGISASLLMARLSAEARNCLAIEPTPAAAIGRLNRAFCDSGWEGRFVTLALAVLDPLRHHVTIVNSGHMPPLLRRGSAAVEAVAEAEARYPLGVDREETYAQCTVPLGPGDSLTLYTDGITEAMNHKGELYGHQRLWTQLGSKTQRVTKIGQAILNDVKRFVGTRPQSDDMCLACFGRESGGEE